MAVSNPFFCLVNAAVSAQTSSQSVADRVNRLNPHSRERRDDAAQGSDARGSLPRRYEKLDQGGGPAWLGVLRNYLPISMLTP